MQYDDDAMQRAWTRGPIAVLAAGGLHLVANVLLSLAMTGLLGILIVPDLSRGNAGRSDVITAALAMGVCVGLPLVLDLLVGVAVVLAGIRVQRGSGPGPAAVLLGLAMVWNLTRVVGSCVSVSILAMPVYLFGALAMLVALVVLLTDDATVEPLASPGA